MGRKCLQKPWHEVCRGMIVALAITMPTFSLQQSCQVILELKFSHMHVGTIVATTQALCRPWGENLGIQFDNLLF
jgi:hypothetical protein